MATAVVIGAGVSGLSSAYYIQRYLPKYSKVIVLEGSKRVGGWVNTTINPDGSIFEHGPRSLRPVGEPGKNTIQLAEELGLEKDVLPVFSTDPAAKNRYLFVKGKLHALPSNVPGLFKKLPPFSKPLVRMLAREPFQRRSKAEDESIYTFVNRRLGSEMADIAINAMCRGIFAGDCRKLSIQACFPALHEYEKKYGSLVAGALFLGGKGPKVELTGLAKRAKQEKWSTWSLRHGLQQLVDSMADAVRKTQGGDIRLDSPCTAILPREGGKVLVKTSTDSIETDLVISSIYSKDLAPLLPDSFSTLKQDLAALSAVTVVVVNLEYKDNVLPVKGFGHLLPSFESGPILGIIYDSCTFPEHNRKGAPDSTRLTVMMGGTWYKGLLKFDGSLPSGSELVWMATKAAAKHLGIKSRPVRSQVTLQEDCIPQYSVGHVNWVNRVEDRITESNLPLKLAGSSYRGVAINDCIFNAKKTILSLKGS